MPEAQAGVSTPVETPVAATTATPTPETTAGQESQVQTPEPPKQEKLLTQEEVNKLVAREKARAQRHAERIATERAEALYYKRLHEQSQQPQQQRKGEPQPTDFKTYEEYVNAVIEHRLEQRLAAREQEGQTQRQQREAQQQAAQMRERILDGADEFEDFEEVALADHVPISTAMAAAISESDIPAKLAYYLGSHLEEARKIFGLPPTKQVREIAKIESKLTATPKPQTVPEPIKPNSGNAPGEKPIEEQDYDSFVKTRHKQLAAKGKRRYQT